MNCIFCQIASGAIPSAILHKDESAVAFRDIHPQAPVHIVIIPVKHFTNLTELKGIDYDVVAHIFEVANDLARKEGIAESGYRIAVNSGKEGGQVVQHLHFHLLGGRQLSGELG
ncbi:histidine triad nucleotide-binding protein [Dehalogenimonas etheniformans]|uniref:Histidine triad nucleotide-binding protein n=1 Tax=Dehalogenimonas etheniformans TaxID=1536648 RepID=A0A2P5P8N4_9CHLR|nr:histidine triad nucleotide-binding protein [Dehalogenimonas etheniformans]PPD58650.1 histidine triad nucleotide-binding protein [Dehalogenimonas etheniformans]QNT76579.1 histidine triad nucleotide-binding protein [Dehalogenimonas etheniformans]